MAYCRFSSDDFKCDVYCYEGGDGFVVHVAGNRVLGDIPPTPALRADTVPAYMEAHARQMAFLDTCKRESIHLPHAGTSLDYDSADECAEGLEMLRALGYNVPQYAIDALRAEAEQEGASDAPD